MPGFNLDRCIAFVTVNDDINLAARFCDRIIALKGGRMIAQGPPGDFMTEARLEEIYEVAMGVFPHPDTRGAIAYVREKGGTTWQLRPEGRA